MSNNGKTLCHLWTPPKGKWKKGWPFRRFICGYKTGLFPNCTSSIMPLFCSLLSQPNFRLGTTVIPRGVLPILAHTERLCQKGVLFSGFRFIWKDRDFTRWSIWKGREICHLGLWKGPKGRTNEFYGFIKSGKRSIFVIDSYLNDNVFTEQLKGMQSSKQSIWKGYHLSVEDRRYSFREKWYIKG